MSRNRVELGVPSLTGRVAELIAKSFAGCVYPINAKVVNRMPHDITLSEVRGLYLRGVTVSDGSNKRVVQIESEDQFIRMASSVQQIAVLNSHEYVVMTVEAVSEAEEVIEPERKPAIEPEKDQDHKKEPEGTEESEHSGEKNGADSEDDETKSSQLQASDESSTVDTSQKVNHRKNGKFHSSSNKNGD